MSRCPAVPPVPRARQDLGRVRAPGPLALHGIPGTRGRGPIQAKWHNGRIAAMPLGRATERLYLEILIQASTSSPQARAFSPSLAGASCFLPGAQSQPQILAYLGTNSPAVNEVKSYGIVTVFRLSYDGHISYFCGVNEWLLLLRRADFPVRVSTGGRRIDRILGASSNPTH